MTALRQNSNEKIRTQIRPGTKDFTAWVKTNEKERYFRIPLRLLDPNNIIPTLFPEPDNDDNKAISEAERREERETDEDKFEFQGRNPRKRGRSSPGEKNAEKKTKTEEIEEQTIIDLIDYLGLTKHVSN